MRFVGRRVLTVVLPVLGIGMLLAGTLAGQDTTTAGAAVDSAPLPQGPQSPGELVKRVTDSAGHWSEEQEERFSIPESPAFTFLNTSPAEITRPSNWREFSVSLLSGVNESGAAQQGFALELAPFQVVPGFQVNLKEYREDFFKRAAYRTQVSLGTVQASGDSGSTDIAFGIRVPLLDDGDLMQNAAYARDLGAGLLECAPPSPGAGAEARECLRKQKMTVDSMYRELLDLRGNWRTRRLVVAFAFGTRLVNSSFSNGQALGWSTWALGSNPLGRWGMVVGSLRVSRRQEVAGQPGFSSVRYGGRAIVGSTGVNGFLEVVGDSRFDRDPGADQGKTSWAGGLEVRLSHGIWLSTGFGQRYAEAQAPDRVVVIANLRWGLSAEPRNLVLSAAPPGAAPH
jgi:hypothetical protein